ncbi:UNVERIFIED_CONTAM: hypothetical protein NCL1_38097 [Trichonephila clavipes]
MSDASRIVSATLVFGYHFDMAKKLMLTQDEIVKYMNNLDELSEDGLEYFDDDVDFYQINIKTLSRKILWKNQNISLNKEVLKFHGDDTLPREIMDLDSIPIF